MKVNSIQQQNFRGSFTGKFTDTIGDKLAKAIVKHPKTVTGIAGLAGCGVIAQKLVMSAGEVAVAPFVDIGVGKAITKITNEKDGRTNQSSKVQAARTVAQTIGGTIVGVTVRAVCILAAGAFCKWAVDKSIPNITDKLTEMKFGKKFNPEVDLYKKKVQMEKWGKNIGGTLATLVMMYTNFAIDAPLINKINKKISPLFGIKIEEQDKAKEAN